MSTIPAVFGPQAHAAPWWTLDSITPANLGWWITGMLAAAAVITWIWERIADRWEITCGRPRVTRRWYGTRAHVCLRDEAGDPDAVRFDVLGWACEHTAIPWLLVRRIDGPPPTYRDADGFVWPLGEGEEAFWSPVTEFAPYTVRWLRPHILRSEHFRFPELFDYRPVRRPSGYPAGVRDAA